MLGKDNQRQDCEDECCRTLRQQDGSAVGRRHWGHLLSVAAHSALHLTHHVESRAWPGFETCCFKEQGGENQTKLVVRIVVLESPGFFQCIFPVLTERRAW